LEVAQNLEKLEYFPYLCSSLLAKKRQNLKNGINATIWLQPPTPAMYSDVALAEDSDKHKFGALAAKLFEMITRQNLKKCIF
jgi:hypothetical protein